MTYSAVPNQFSKITAISKIVSLKNQKNRYQTRIIRFGNRIVPKITNVERIRLAGFPSYNRRPSPIVIILVLRLRFIYNGRGIFSRSKCFGLRHPDAFPIRQHALPTRLPGRKIYDSIGTVGRNSLRFLS